jgi:hypothetical protein
MGRELPPSSADWPPAYKHYREAQDEWQKRMDEFARDRSSSNQEKEEVAYRRLLDALSHYRADLFR